MTAGPKYGRPHRRTRAWWEREIRAHAGVRCARGPYCKHAEDGLGGWIRPGDPWDLGHVDSDPSRYQGPEHPQCNRATTGRAGTRRRKAETHPGLLG